MQNAKEFSEEWKKFVGCIAAVALIVSLTLGATTYFAKASTQREMQRQIYIMQLNANIRDLQAQINFLHTQKQTPAVQNQIAVLQGKINVMLKEMMAK